MTDPQKQGWRERPAYKELKESAADLKLSIADFKASLPWWVLTWGMLYLAVVMFLTLTPFRLIAALMLSIRIRWLANWFLERVSKGREERHGV